MGKNLLIISAEYTGHGHKSITESLCEKFQQHDDVSVNIIDGFSLGGSLLEDIGKCYGPITRNYKELWGVFWNISSLQPKLVNRFIEYKISYNFIQVLKKVKPDIILSVHPNFNGSIINILKKHKIDIPVVTLIADLVSIYPLWADSKADFIISPTEEAKDKCIEFGVSEEKIKVLGFPVRSRFSEHLKSLESGNYYHIEKPLNCLIMSGGEGAGNMEKIAQTLLDNFNCNVKIIAGRNDKLKDSLENSLVEKYKGKIEIYGFIKNVQDLMRDSDIAFTRGSPNVMMEAVACNVPIVITDALPGQEAGNPGLVEKYNLGVVCRNSDDVKNIISDLLMDNAKKLKYIKKCQMEYFNPSAAENIANFILSVEYKNTGVIFPAEDKNFWNSIDKKYGFNVAK